MAPTVLLEYTKRKQLKKKNTRGLSLKMMSKSQKFLGGKSSGFVPGYRHAVEMVGESEGMGSLGRAYSEDSSAPKRKCISLNVGRDDGFNVPQRFISISKLLGSERKKLDMGLRAELEQVQTLQKRICSMAVTSTSAVAVSSSSNGHEKKQGPVRPNGSKRGATGRSESTKHVRCPPVINSDVLLMKHSEQLLKRLMSHKFGWVFSTPVDVVKLKVPDYYTVIKHPMDLGTIKAKIASSAYSNPWGFAADVRLTFTNAMTFNPPGNDFHFMADVMSKFFETRWRPIEKMLAAADSGVKRKAEPPMKVPQPKKRKVPVVNHHIIMQETVKPNITVEEKQTKQHAMAEPCGMEIPNESGHLNSSKHPFTGNEPADEDVDIGGNDPPISSYPPVDIEKDTAPRSSKCSSSSSSSSDSSSSDSDSGSSSGSESGDRGACPAKTAKVSCGRETTADQKRSDTMDSLDTNRNVNGLDQLEPAACHKPGSVEKDDCKQGGTAPSGRRVSPDRLYRAALLRSRFADTILKAREKTLGQNEKEGDPETLRREREELERRQRKERARLHAEAKAAEEACRRAKAEAAAEAAAEAKHKRELEREAARQALLKMEKTVEIYENKLIYKNLEMLRAEPGDLAYSSVGETSPDLSPDRLGCFQLSGSNPLEKLGLFMKADDDDEEEPAEPSRALADDVEEGEIRSIDHHLPSVLYVHAAAGL